MFICLLKKGEKKKKRGGRKKKLWGWNKIWRVGQEGFGNIASKISEGGGKKIIAIEITVIPTGITQSRNIKYWNREDK